MSYYNLPDNAYQSIQASTPGWQTAPVPGWGVNPLLAGPKRLAANGVGDVPIRSIISDWTLRNRAVGADSSEKAGNEGMIALAAAGGIFLGWALAWVYWSNKKKK